MVRERERQRGDLKHLSVHQWIRFAIPDSQQPTSPIGFLFLKLPPPPCAVLLVNYGTNGYEMISGFVCRNFAYLQTRLPFLCWENIIFTH